MFLLDLLFPKFCLGCGFLGSYICHNCKCKLIYLEKDLCIYCHKASLYGLTHPTCKRGEGVDGVISIFHYNNLLKSIIKSIKYRLATEVWNELCLTINPDKLNKIKIFQELAVSGYSLQPIPLHPNKFKKRGFNQAQIIADFFSKFLRVGLADNLIRIKDTQAQAQIAKNQARYFNMRGAFEAKNDTLIGSNIILVDDVMTTGSTLKEAARVLKTAGARKVYVLTLAKG